MGVNIADAIQYHRNLRGLSQRAAAKELDISYPYLNRLENDKASPTFDMIQQINEAWGVDLYLTALSLSSPIPDWLKPVVRIIKKHNVTIASTA